MDIKKGQDIELVVKDSLFGGKAIGYLDQIKVTTDRGVPGQKLLVRITKRRPEKLEGKTIEVLEKSSIETEKACIHSGVCGGCSMQGVGYQYQLAMKNKQVIKLFKEEHISVEEWRQPIGSPQEQEYRNKMEFTFGNEYKEGPLTLGMHQRRRRFDIVDTYECRLIDEDLRRVRTYTVNFFKENQLKPYHKISREGTLRHLVVRKAYYTGEIMVNLVTTSTPQDQLISSWTEGLKKLALEGSLKSVLWTINDALADMVKSDKTILMYGESSITEKLQGITFKITPFSFFQTNSSAANKLYQVVANSVAKSDKTIFDLYCGLGTITQILAQNAEKVVGIDIVEEAIQQAQKSAEENGLPNCEFIAGDVKEKLSMLKKVPDMLVLDPPRPGVHPEAMEDLIHMNPAKILYVSCNPKTLVQNLKQAIAKGYIIEWVQCVDLFPSTPHVECVVLMSRVDK